MKLLFLVFASAALALFVSCSKEASTVLPPDITSSPSGNSPGDNTPRLSGIYPESASTDIPVDADIVLVFSEPVNILTINPSNVVIPGVSSFIASNVTDGRTVIIDITTPANLNYNTLYSVQVNMGVTGAGGIPLDSVYNSTFTTALNTSAQSDPRIIAITRYPAPGAPGVNVNQPYVELTFSKDMNPLTIDTASFGLTPAAGIGVTQINAKTYRLDLGSLAYNTSYTVDLTGAVTDTLGNALVQDGNDTWIFTTETDPDTAGALAFGSIWVNSVSPTTAWIYFTTNKPADRINFEIDFDINTGAPYTWTSAIETDWDSDGVNLHTLHKIQLTGLSASTPYYFRVQEASVPLASAEYTFITSTNTAAPVSNVLTDALNDQDRFRIVQMNNGSSYVFWESHDANDDIYGQFFDNIAAAQWGPTGLPVCSNANIQNSIVAIGDEVSGDAIMIYMDATAGDSLYAKELYNSAGLQFRWGGAAPAQGADLGITIAPGSNYSATLQNSLTTFLVASVDVSNYVTARAFNLADGSAAGLSFDVCTNGASSNPVATSDSVGDVIIFYQNSGNIYWKKVDGTGAFLWAGAASNAAGIGLTDPGVAGGYIVQVLPDGADGAYLLARNAVGADYNVLRVNGADGSVIWSSGAIAGSDPRMVVDSITAVPNRVIIVYRNTHVVALNTYYHIVARAYTGAGVLAWGPVNVTDNTVTYNCVQPRISPGDNDGTSASSIYISWFDGRYYSTNGYAIFAQLIDNTGTAQWASPSGIFISTPTSYGYDYPVGLELLIWNDGGAPFGLLPIWLDYRNFGVTGNDIYYEIINDTGVY